MTETILFNTQDYWDLEDYGEPLSDDWDYLRDQIVDHVDGRICVIQGTQGLWDGRHRAGSLGDIEELLSKALSVADDWKVTYDGDLHLTIYHHDGHNEYVIRVLNDAGDEFYEEWQNDEHDLSWPELHDKLMLPEYSDPLEV